MWGSTMHMHISMRRVSIVLAIAILLALAACERGSAFQPTAVDEIKPGPGLFTGEAGAFVFYRKGEDE